MFKLDDNLLIELGLGTLPAAEKNRMLSHIYETLEMRVGMKLAQKMTNEQLDEFEAFIDRNDEAGALKWLETNFPNYKQVVADELEALKAEIKVAAPQIVATSQQQAIAQPIQSVQPAPTAQAQPAQYPSPNQQYAPQQPQQFPSPASAPQPMQQPLQPIQPAPPQIPSQPTSTPQSAPPQPYPPVPGSY